MLKANGKRVKGTCKRGTAPSFRRDAQEWAAERKEEGMNGKSTSIVRKGAVAACASALLLSGLFVGVSYGRGGGIPEPEVIELVTTGCATNDDDPATDCRVYELTDDEGGRSGTIFRFKVWVEDVDGNRVGYTYLQCDIAKGTGRTCTNVLVLRPGPYTERGTIVSMGVQPFPPPAIVGGSGAYLNVRGEVFGEEQNDGFHLFVHLIP